MTEPTNVHALARSGLANGSPPNPNFLRFIEQAKATAASAGIAWSMRLSAEGVSCDDDVWDLRAMAADGRPGKLKLRTFSHVEDAHASLVSRGLRSLADPPPKVVSPAWQDIIKAHTVEHVLIRKKGLQYIGQSTNAWRFLATVSNKEPWQVTAEDVQLACEISDECQPSGGRSIILMALISSIVDLHHLFDACPLTALVQRQKKVRAGRAKFAQAEMQQAKTLSERKAEEKLPERRAFWEIIRIVYTETPKTLTDALRFAMVKLLLITGMRISEVALLPLDWRRTRTYLGQNGQPAGDFGGVSESLSIRHFAEKQDNRQLYESTQFVPDMFRDEVERIMADVIRLTAPLRKTLRDQGQTGRVFPMYQPDELVDALEMYVRLSGNPIWTEPISIETQAIVDSFKVDFDSDKLLCLYKSQRTSKRLSAAVSVYFTRAVGLRLRDEQGRLAPDRGVRGRFIHVGEAEAYVRSQLKTKLSDLNSLTLDNGSTVAPWDMLFVMPKRAVGAGRGQTILDPNTTFSIGIADGGLILYALGGSSDSQSLFRQYGQTSADHDLSITSHAFRHLQNTELFRLGVADTIISKRFNRRNVAQSYEYDHRSLAEELDAIELPDDWSIVLGESKATDVAKMIVNGRANGPIVGEFKRIQIEEGDEAALRFLMMEADGFHATPYGTCLNSFTVDPCPKHLECFNGCRHLSATGLPEQHRNLVNLHDRLKLAYEAAERRPEGAIGKTNQLAHAKARLDGIEKLLTTPPNEAVFPDGVDLSLSAKPMSVLHGTKTARP